MADILFLLREPLKRFVKYLSVPVGSLPAGLLYLLLLKFLAQSVALVVVLLIGVASVYYLWAIIDKWLLVSRPSFSEYKLQEVPVEPTTAYALPGPYMLSGALALAVFVATASPSTHPQSQEHQSTNGSSWTK